MEVEVVMMVDDKKIKIKWGKVDGGQSQFIFRLSCFAAAAAA